MVDVSVFSVLLYTFGIILLIVLIILGIKLIFLVDKADRVLNTVDERLNSFNGMFDIINRLNGSLTSILDTFVYSALDKISKVISRKKEKGKDEENE